MIPKVSVQVIRISDNCPELSFDIGGNELYNRLYADYTLELIALGHYTLHVENTTALLSLLHRYEGLTYNYSVRKLTDYIRKRNDSTHTYWIIIQL